MKKFLKFAAAAIILFGVYVLLVWNGIVPFNHPPREEYPIHGITVSSWQGNIDWNELARQNIRFAFIKATEGNDLVDPKFGENWERARRTNLMVGAYHFFSYDTPGKAQALNFIKTVPIENDSMPPVVDIEFYGNRGAAPAARNYVEGILNDLLIDLEKHYGKKPILYATPRTYQLYLKGAYPEHLIWIRSLFSRPSMPDGREWTFWQYTSRGKLQGYDGMQKFIDLNAFCSDDVRLRTLFGERDW